MIFNDPRELQKKKAKQVLTPQFKLVASKVAVFKLEVFNAKNHLRLTEVK